MSENNGDFHHRHHAHLLDDKSPAFYGALSAGGWFTWFPTYKDTGKRDYTVLGYLLCFGLFFVVLLVLFLALALTTDDHNSSVDDTQYSPLDTRILHYSKTFCASIEMDDSDDATPARLFRLRSTPPLTSRYTFSISDVRTVAPSSYIYWYYFMHVGSFMNATLCVKSNSVDFFVIKGTDNFRRWTQTQNNYIFHKRVSNKCSSNISDIVTTVDSADFYFFAFASSSTGASVDYDIQFNQTKYTISQDNVEDFCIAGGEHAHFCSVAIPYTTPHVILMEVGNTSSSKGFEQPVDIKWSCAPRVWVYMMAFLLPPAAALVIVMSLCVLCYMYRRQKKAFNNNYVSLNHRKPSVPKIRVATTSFMASSSSEASIGLHPDNANADKHLK